MVESNGGHQGFIWAPGRYPSDSSVPLAAHIRPGLTRRQLQPCSSQSSIPTPHGHIQAHTQREGHRPPNPSRSTEHRATWYLVWSFHPSRLPGPSWGRGVSRIQPAVPVARCGHSQRCVPTEGHRPLDTG